MKLKQTVLLATLVVTMGLLLGTSAAQAAEVITDDDGNVIRIENLEVIDLTSTSTFYNVEFVYDTATNVYGSDLEFDFPIAGNAPLALEAVTDALNGEDPTPPTAGPQGTDQFFIGALKTTVGGGGTVVGGLGGEFFGDFWNQCETGCILGVAPLDPDNSFTYADFTVSEDAPPGIATIISPSGTITDNMPTYTWNAVESSTWYRLQVNDSTQAKKIYEWYTADDADCGDGTGECSVTPGTELADGKAKWWIQTYNDAGDGPWSDKLEFTVDTGTGGLPGKATIISPSGTVTESNPTYTWNAVESSTWYRLQVNDSTKAKKIYEWYTAEDADCGDGTGECSVTPGTKLADGKAKWWIQTWNDAGDGPWSDKLEFTVETGTSEPPEKTTLISPSGTITDNTPTYTWNAVESSTWYRLQVNDSDQDEKILKWYTADEADCGDGTGECSVTPGTDLADGAAKWWIRTWNDLGNGPWSAGMDFRVNTDTVDPGVNVETDGDGNVTRITNLPVLNENTGETIIYNVDFVFDSAINVYGSDFDFDFTEPEDDENIIIAMETVLDALNFADPTPRAAGPQGSEWFFIGYDEDALVVAVGGQYFRGIWDQCEVDCIAGVRVMDPTLPSTWADFTVAD